MLAKMLLWQNEHQESINILQAHLLQIWANFLLQPLEKTALTQDGRQQFLILKAQKEHIVLLLTMHEVEETQVGLADQKQLTHTFLD